MQQTTPSLMPAAPSLIALNTGIETPDAADLDLGYEGAFPFLAETRSTDAIQHC